MRISEVWPPWWLSSAPAWLALSVGPQCGAHASQSNRASACIGNCAWEPSGHEPADVLRIMSVGAFGSPGPGASAFSTTGKRSIGSSCEWTSLASRLGTVRQRYGHIERVMADDVDMKASIAWQDTPTPEGRVGHVPAAGPLVLIGVATLIGGPRRPRASRGGSCAGVALGA